METEVSNIYYCERLPATVRWRLENIKFRHTQNFINMTKLKNTTETPMTVDPVSAVGLFILAGWEYSNYMKCVEFYKRVNESEILETVDEADYATKFSWWEANRVKECLKYNFPDYKWHIMQC